MCPLRRCSILPLAASLLALAVPASAEIYKWVDDKGVVNYGSTPPAGRTVKELPKEAPGISVVPAPPPSPAAARNPTDERVERLERELAAERAAREARDQRAEDQREAAIAECEANRGVDCDENPYQFSGYGYGYAPAWRHGVRPHPIPPPVKPHPPKPGKPQMPVEPEPASGALMPRR